MTMTSPRRFVWQHRTGLARLAVPIVVLCLWQILSLLIDSPAILATVPATAQILAQGVRDGWLLDGVATTIAETLLGFVGATVLGTVLGVAFGLHRGVDRLVQPFLMSAWSAPKIVFYPMFLFTLGLGIWSKAGLAVSFGIFPVIMFTIRGIDSVPATHFKLAKALRLNRIQVFRKVIFPASVPYLLVGARYAFSLSFIGAILGEMFGSSEGLGSALVQAQALADVARMLAVVVIVAVIGLAGNFLFFGLENRLSRVRVGTSARQVLE